MKDERRDQPLGRGSGRRHMGGPGIGMPFEKAKNVKAILKRLIQYLKPQLPKFLAVFVAAILSTIFSIVSPKIMGKAITKIFEGLTQKMMNMPGADIDFNYIFNIILILIVLYIISAFFSYLQGYIMAGVAQKTVYNMREEVNKKLSKLPLKYFDSHTHGEILSRVTNDLDNIANTLQQSLTQLVTSVATILGIIIMMLTISPVMTLICIATLPLYIVVTKSIAGRSQRYFSEQQKALGLLNGHVEEMFTGHQIIKAFGREPKSLKVFNDINEDLYASGYKAQFVSGVIMPLMNFINNIGYVLVCVVGGIYVAKRAMEIGDVQAFIQYARQFTQPIVHTANIVNILQSSIASAERVFNVLDEEEELQDKSDAVSLEEPRGMIQFKDVRFGYEKDTILIEKMNIEVKAGQTIAIVGPTGAGKTTLVNLLMRFYEISDGVITLDGVDIRNIKRGELRRTYGMVLQDTWLFNGTIMENIAYGREGATSEAVIKAAKAAYADHFIRTLPKGYDTMLNEEASNISQGQKQLLTIARAILADPAVLILDEATSSVDTRTEIHIQIGMKELMKGRTSFVIAHRLSTIRDADLILVMKNGSIIEQGNHQELLEKNGFYSELYHNQFNHSIDVAS